MAPYDAFVNPSSSAAEGIPYVVVIQSDVLDALPHYAAPLPSRLLKRPVDNAAAQASTLLSAMDAVLSGL
jgi:toxin CcdB